MGLFFSNMSLLGLGSSLTLASGGPSLSSSQVLSHLSSARKILEGDLSLDQSHAAFVHHLAQVTEGEDSSLVDMAESAIHLADVLAGKTAPDQAGVSRLETIRELSDRLDQLEGLVREPVDFETSPVPPVLQVPAKRPKINSEIQVRPIKRIFVSNRGEAAARLIQAVKQLRADPERDHDTEVVVMYTDVDKDAPWVTDPFVKAVYVPPSRIKQVPVLNEDGSPALNEDRTPKTKPLLPYLDVDLIKELIQESGADAVWPGWGFLSESDELADMVNGMGVRFIGPSGDAMREAGDKIGFKKLADPHQTSWGYANTLEEALATADRLAYPVVIKGTSGGGGRGIKFARNREELIEKYPLARAEAKAAFNNDVVYIEKAVVPVEYSDLDLANILQAKAGEAPLGENPEAVSLESALEMAAHLQYPFVLKSAPGDAEKGVKIVDEESLSQQLPVIISEAREKYGSERVYFEKVRPRHVEIQVVRDQHGNVWALGDRDCSVQRNNQKIIEEAPAPNIPGHIRRDMYRRAMDVLEQSNYVGVATVEGLYNDISGDFSPMELNARLQVEHTITEMVTGVDLVKEQIRVAEGHPLTSIQTPEPSGHAIEVRINAENADDNFSPTGGTLDIFRPPPGRVRVDTGVSQGNVIQPGYDPMIAKVIVRGHTRRESMARMYSAIQEFVIAGALTNKSLILELLPHPAFRDFYVSNQWLNVYMERRKPWEVKRHSQESLIATAVMAYQSQQAEYSQELHAILKRGRPPDIPKRREALYAFQLFDRQYRLTVRECSTGVYQVSVGGRCYEVETSSKGRVQSEVAMMIDGNKFKVIGSEKRGSYTMELNGTAFQVSRPLTGELIVESNGTVHDIKVAIGDEVKPGEVVMQVEAMKSVMPLKAGVGGRVSEIRVKKGQGIEAGQVLVVISQDKDKIVEPTSPHLSFEPQQESALVSLIGEDEARIKTNSQNIKENLPVHFDRIIDTIREAVMGYDTFDLFHAFEQKKFSRKQKISSFAKTLLEILGEAQANHISSERMAHAVVRILDPFVDIELLFQRDLKEGENGRSMVDSFYQFLKTRVVEEAEQPQFYKRLMAALSHYGIQDLSPSVELDQALTRMILAHEGLPIRQEVIKRLFAKLGGVLDGDALENGHDLSGVLDKYSLLDRGLAEVTHTALGLLFKLREARHSQAYASAAIQTVQQRLPKAATLAAGSAERRALLEELDLLPEAIVPQLVEILHTSEAAKSFTAAEVLFRRFYLNRHEFRDFRQVETADNRVYVGLFQDGEAESLRSCCLVAGNGDQLSPEQRSSLIQHAIQQLRLERQGQGVFGEEIVSHDNTIELFMPVSEQEISDLSRVARDLMNNIGYVSPELAIKRISCTMASPSGTWDYLTFRQDPENPGTYIEDELFRSVHPYRAYEIELWRLGRYWHRHKLTTPWINSHLFLATEKDGKDAKLLAYAIVPQLSLTGAPDGLRIPEAELALGQSIHSLRDESLRPTGDIRARIEGAKKRVYLVVRPQVTASRGLIRRAIQRLSHSTRGLDIERTTINIRRFRFDDSEEYRPMTLIVTNPGGTGLSITESQPARKPQGYIRPRSAYDRRVDANRRRGIVEPYFYLNELTADRGYGAGAFVEYDIRNEEIVADSEGKAAVQYQLMEGVEPNFGKRPGKIIFGVLTRRSRRHPEGVQVVQIVNDGTDKLCPLQGPECARVLAAMELAESRGLEIDWKATSSGAGISMERGTENLDWTALVMRRIGEFTDAGGIINIIVDGGNIGAQSYWDANATMLLRRRGLLIMTPTSYMALTGNGAQKVAGSVGAEDNIGLAGATRIMGPNGEMQFIVSDIQEGTEVLWRHHELTWRAPGEVQPKDWETDDPYDRDVTQYVYTDGSGEEWNVGTILTEAAEKKMEFPVAAIMEAVRNLDAPVQERWQTWTPGGAGIVRVMQTAIGPSSVMMIGLEARRLKREGEIPPGYPAFWTASTLFPEGSEKLARALGAASGRSEVVIIANLSGFDGSPESLLNKQLQKGTWLAEAVRKFSGKINFIVTTRYHGGAYVVFSYVLNPDMTVSAGENTFASVVGGHVAAEIVFTREIDDEAERILTGEAYKKSLAAASSEEARQKIRDDARDDVKTSTRERYDGIHTVQRAKDVGSIHEIVPAAQLRPWLIAQLTQGRHDQRQRVEDQLALWARSFTFFAGQGDVGIAQWERAVRALELGPFMPRMRRMIDDLQLLEGPRSDTTFIEGAPVSSMSPVPSIAPVSNMSPESVLHFSAQLGRNPRLLDLGLPMGHVGHHTVVYPEVGSTNDVARDFARKSMMPGTVIVADHQTAGRGRSQNRWHAQPGLSLLMSADVMMPVPAVEDEGELENVSRQFASRLPGVTAVAIAKTISELAVSAPTIKWPNDIYLGAKKLAGILIEQVGDNRFVIGIGLNTNVHTRDFDPEIRQKATSLLLDTQKTWSHEAILKRLLPNLQRELEHLVRGEWSDQLEYLTEHFYLTGRRVAITNEGEVKRGVVIGPHYDGALILRNEQEGQEVVYSGTVTLEDSGTVESGRALGVPAAADLESARAKLRPSQVPPPPDNDEDEPGSDREPS